MEKVLTRGYGAIWSYGKSKVQRLAYIMYYYVGNYRL